MLKAKKTIKTYIEQRITELKVMHLTMQNINDEEYYYTWIVLGVPDGATEEDFESIAEDNEQYFEVVEEFIKLMNLLKEEDEEEYKERYSEFITESLK